MADESSNGKVRSAKLRDKSAGGLNTGFRFDNNSNNQLWETTED